MFFPPYVPQLQLPFFYCGMGEEKERKMNSDPSYPHKKTVIKQVTDTGKNNR